MLPSSLPSMLSTSELVPEGFEMPRNRIFGVWRFIMSVLLSIREELDAGESCVEERVVILLVLSGLDIFFRDRVLDSSRPRLLGCCGLLIGLLSWSTFVARAEFGWSGTSRGERMIKGAAGVPASAAKHLPEAVGTGRHGLNQSEHHRLK